MKENFDAFKNKAKNIVNATVIAGMSVLPQKSTGESIRRIGIKINIPMILNIFL